LVDERRVEFATTSLSLTIGLSTLEAAAIDRTLLTGVTTFGVTSVAETERREALGVPFGVTVSADLSSAIFGGRPTLFDNSEITGDAAWMDVRLVALEGVLAADLDGDIALSGDMAFSSTISEILPRFGFSGIGDNCGTTANALLPRLPGVRGRGDAGRGEASSLSVSVRDDLRAGVVALVVGSLPLTNSGAFSAAVDDLR
jgi:hypothetical protein